MKKRAMSMLLVLLMVVTLFPTFVPAAAAADEYGITNPEDVTDKSGHLNLSKELSVGANGTYDLTLQAYATGEVTTEVLVEQVPTDFVLVLDQSGSMSTTDMPTGFTKVNQTNFSTQNIVDAVNNDDPYYFLAPDGKYYPVHERDAGTYSQLSGIHIYKQNGLPLTGLGAKDGLTKMEMPFVARTNVTGESDGTTEAYYLYKGVYYRLSVYAVGLPLRFQGTPFFTDANGTRHNLKTYTYTWGIGDFVINPEITDTIYKKTSTAYRLYYLDENGNAVDIGSQVNNRSTTAYSGDLYKKNADESRLSALKKSVNTFIDTIASQKNADGNRVDHRVAIVGFASGNQRSGATSIGSTSYYEINEYGDVIGQNTELFDGATQKNYFTDNLQDADYLAALKSTDQAGVQQLKASVDALEANGATFPNYGLQMAENVYTSRGDEGSQYTKLDGVTKDKRNMVVVMFTDGVPGLNDYDNQFRAANNVVAEAKNLKDMDAEVYTVGVFSQDDTHPLQYSLKKHDTTTNSYSETAASQPNFLYSEMQTYTNGNYAYTYYMFRGNNTMEANGTDTVGNYMRVVSSDYENATAFMDSNTPNPSTGITGRGAATSNTHYMRASDTKALENVFKTIATSVNHTATPVELRDNAVIKDIVNTGDFDISGATYTVKWEPIKWQSGEVVNNGPMQTKVPEAGEDAPAVPADGVINYRGFDYAGYYVSSEKPEGYRLVITISGLQPKKASGTLHSNVGNAAIYAEGVEKPAVEIGSPTLELSAATTTKHYTYVIDTNAKTRLATESHQLVAADNNDNGVFAKSADKGPYDVTYQLNAGEQNGEMTTVNNNQEYRATINSAYTTVDTALVYGKPYDLDTKAFAGEAGWTKITTVPASSVYYDDSFTEENAQVLKNPGDVVKQTGTFDGSNSHIFTFYGTGIDVYCTTNDNGGYVSARVYQGNTTSGTVEGTVTVKNQSQGAYYNTPTVHFADLTPGYHTVWIYANGNANYQIDGVRVYNPVQANTTAATEQSKTDEANANYFNLHDLLLNASSKYDALSKEDYENLDDASAVAVSGVLYLDNAANICLQSNDENGDPQLIFNSDFNLYEKNSPINEIYLQTTNGQPQGVAFKLNTWTTGEKAYLGVSAPKGSGKVLINGKELPVTSSVDQYYDITEYITNGVVSIKTDKNDANLVSVTNLKITHVDPGQVIGQNPTPDATDGRNAARRLAFAPMTTATVEEIAQQTVPELFAAEPENPGTPDTPETPDQPDDPTPGAAGSVQEMLKQLFESLMKNLFGLFKGLGNW